MEEKEWVPVAPKVPITMVNPPNLYVFPVSKIDRVLRFVREREDMVPLYGNEVPAGFPSPADDYAEGVLDLNAHLIREPTATFFVRARGDSMIGAGIHDGDLLVVDRSLEATNGKVVIVSINGELTVKRLRRG